MDKYLLLRSQRAIPLGSGTEAERNSAVALKQFTDRGWESDVGFIRPDETAGPTVERQLCPPDVSQ
jgi:hypothetical protein